MEDQKKKKKKNKINVADKKKKQNFYIKHYYDLILLDLSIVIQILLIV